MIPGIATMATAVLLALGSTTVRGDGLITANSTLDAAKQTLNTTANLTMESRIAMTIDGTMARTFATSSRRPITTKLTTVYGTKVVVVSTTGSPISTYTLTGPTPGPPKNGPLRGINKCEMVDHGTWKQWHIVSFDADLYNEPTKYCGSGYLDNFRGECRVINDWGCGCTDGRPWPCSDIWMSFETDMFCAPAYIRTALHKASSGNIEMSC